MKNNYLLQLFLLSIFFSTTMTINAQNGEPCFNASYIPNPYGIVEPNVSTLVKLVDIDHDDTLEAFVTVSGPEVHYYENEGSNTEPEFVNPQTAPFGITNAAWQFADVNGDGLHELFIGHFSDDAPITMIDNTGDESTPNFQGDEEPNPYGITLPESNGNVLDNAFPAFVDIDNDGDYDVFITGRFINSLPDEALFFLRNNGTSTNPQFDSIEVNPFGFDFQLTEHARLAIFADMDCDGDFDMYMNAVPTNIDFYFENKGTPEVADFKVDGNPTSNYQNPFSSAGGDFLDIDDDGDLDLFNGSLNAGVQLYKNTGSSTEGCPCFVTGVKENKFDGNLTISPNPAQDELKLTISSESILKEIDLSIYDVIGRRIMKAKREPIGNEFSETIDVRHLPPNIYFVEINVNGYSISKKILIGQ